MHHPLNRPPQSSGLIRIALNVNDRWEHSQQDVCVIAHEGEATTDQEELAAPVVGDDTAIPRAYENFICVNWR